MAQDNMKRNPHRYHTGFSDHLEPLEPLNLQKVQSFDDLMKGMSKTAFAGRSLGEAADILYAMVTDPDCFVVGTFSGAMTIAKMGLLLCDMIELGMLQAVVSTGALMAHGLSEGTGMTHFKYDQRMDDRKLFDAGYDRVYDTLELEQNLDDIEEVFDAALAEVPDDEILCSFKINRLIGAYLKKHVKHRGILKTAFEHNVPVFVPAFTDSELGLDFGLFNRKRMRKGKEPLRFDPFLDLECYTQTVTAQKRLGIFTIGGGVPRNWGQQVGPYLEIIKRRTGEGPGGKRYHYGIRICPEPVHFGGLSGCTYSEGVSWGKFVPKEEGGRWSEVLIDATVGWPIVLKAVMERLKGRKVQKRLAKPEIVLR